MADPLITGLSALHFKALSIYFSILERLDRGLFLWMQVIFLYTSGMRSDLRFKALLEIYHNNVFKVCGFCKFLLAGKKNLPAAGFTASTATVV